MVLHLKRSAWLGIGMFALGAASVGALLPLVPTTPFLLLAAFAFARSSPRLHSWMTRHRVFGPVIRDWQRDGSIARPAKRSAIVAIIATLLASWALGASELTLGIQLVVLTAAAAFILTRPDGGATSSDAARRDILAGSAGSPRRPH